MRAVDKTTFAFVSSYLGDIIYSSRWVHDEKQNHINVLELKATCFGLKSFASDLTNAHIKVTWIIPQRSHM